MCEKKYSTDLIDETKFCCGEGILLTISISVSLFQSSAITSHFWIALKYHQTTAMADMYVDRDKHTSILSSTYTCIKDSIPLHGSWQLFTTKLKKGHD